MFHKPDTFFLEFGTSRAKKWPKTAQKWPKPAKYAQDGDLKVLLVPNGWNSVEQSWNGLWEVQVKVFGPIWRSGVPPNLAQGPPKMAQIGPYWPKWHFEGSGGPKRLEQRGTKVERAVGGPIQVEDFEPIWRSWVPPNLAQRPPKTAQN